MLPAQQNTLNLKCRPRRRAILVVQGKYILASRAATSPPVNGAQLIDPISVYLGRGAGKVLRGRYFCFAELLVPDGVAGAGGSPPGVIGPPWPEDWNKP